MSAEALYNFQKSVTHSAPRFLKNLSRGERMMESSVINKSEAVCTTSDLIRFMKRYFVKHRIERTDLGAL